MKWITHEEGRIMSRVNRRFGRVWLCALVLGAMSVLSANAEEWKFEDAKVGELPKGWSAAKTGEGAGSVWKVLEDATAPKGPKVLAQTSSAGPSPLFNLCVADETSFQNGEVTVSFKAVRGATDQGGGIVWRYIDANNYYVARMNPLEDNYRLYKVVKGKRSQLATKEGLKVPVGEWHSLTVKTNGDRIECFVDGKKFLEASDDTFPIAGKIGLWTKADAQTKFDALVVMPR